MLWTVLTRKLATRGNGITREGTLFVAILLANGSARLLGWFMLAATLIPVGDALIVLRSKGPKTAGYGIHGATALVMAVITVLLLAG